jgi:hypothetical protein
MSFYEDDYGDYFDYYENQERDYWSGHEEEEEYTDDHCSNLDLDSFSPESIIALDLYSDEGWIQALLAIEEFDNWCDDDRNYSESLVCKRSSILIQCVATMLANPVTSQFRNTTKLFLFV